MIEFVTHTYMEFVTYSSHCALNNVTHMNALRVPRTESCRITMCNVICAM